MYNTEILWLYDIKQATKNDEKQAFRLPNNPHTLPLESTGM